MTPPAPAGTACDEVPASLAANARRLLPLAWPVFIGQVAVLAFTTVDTVLVARTTPQDLAALAVGAAAYITVFIGLMGTVLAISPIVGQLYGARRHAEAGNQVHQAVWIAAALAVLGCALLAVPEPFLWVSRVDAEVEAKVRGHLAALAFAVPAALLFTVYRGFNTAVSRPKAVMVLQLLGLSAKVPLAALFIFGASLPTPLGTLTVPALGVVGCGVSTAIVMWLQLALGVAVMARDPFYARFELRGRGLRRPHGPSIRQHLRLGLPIGGSILIEVTAFSFMALFIARLGTTAVAGHQVAINLVSLLFMMPIALSNAASTLVAQAVGAGRLAEARRLGWHGLAIGVALALAVGLGVFAAREPIVRLYTSDPVIVAAAVPLLAWVAVFHVADAAQAVAAFVLRAWKIATVPVLIYAGALWGVGLAGGHALAFDSTGAWPIALRGASGFWVAATAGLVVAAVALVGLLGWVMRRQVAEQRAEHARMVQEAAVAAGTPAASVPTATRAPGIDPHPLVASRLALAVAVGIALTALVLSLLPRVPMPDAPLGDKFVHASGYATLAVAWRLALHQPAVRIAAGVIAFGAGIEVLQGLTPWRSLEWADMLANALGAAIGLAIWTAVATAVRRLRGR